MRIAIYTLTRDRLEYTKTCFARLIERAGHPFDHFVVDNGSEDGTQEWLGRAYFHALDVPSRLMTLDRNRGISYASDVALRRIFNQRANYDLIIKMDNDCLIETPELLAKLVHVYGNLQRFSQRWVLSPRVVGINRQPSRGIETQVVGEPVGPTAIVGGLFHCVPTDVYRAYLDEGGYPLTLPLATGQDDHFCSWVKRNGGAIGYLENMVVEHYEGTDNQAKKYPAYFSRKFDEEKSLA